MTNSKTRSALMLGSACLIGLVLLLLGERLLRYEGWKCNTSIQLELQRVKEEIHAIHLIDLLGLTEEQVARIGVQAEKARPLVEAYWAAMPDMYRFQEPAFTAFLWESEKNEGYSPEVHRAAAEGRYMVKKALKKMVDGVNELAEPLYGIFSDCQLQILRNYRPRLFYRDTGPAQDSPYLSKRAGAIWAAFEAVLKMPEAAYARSVEEQVDRIVDTLPRYSFENPEPGDEGNEPSSIEPPLGLLRFENREDARKRVRGLLLKLRNARPDQVRAEVDGFIARHVNPPSLKELEREMDHIEDSKSPILTIAGRYLLNRDVQAFLKGEPALCCAREETPLEYTKLDLCINEIRKLREKMDLMNLINGLQLSRDQVRSILEEAGRVTPYLGPVSLWEGKTPEELTEELRILYRLRRHLLERREVPASLNRQYVRLLKKRPVIKHPLDLPPAQREEAIQSARRIQKSLLMAQQHILVYYESCLIPPKELSDPLRVGEAGDTNSMILMLDKMRSLAPGVYAKCLDNILARALFWAQDGYGAFTEEQKREFTENMKSIFEQARSMNDVTYALNKRELAEATAPYNREEQLHNCLLESGALKFQVEGRIMEYLFKPLALPLLERRLSLLENGRLYRRPGRGAGMPLSFPKTERAAIVSRPCSCQ